MRGFLVGGIEAGVYRADLDVDLASAFIGGAYDRLARRLVQSKERPDLHALLRGVQHLVLRGVGSTAAVSALARETRETRTDGDRPRTVRPKRSPSRSTPATATRGTDRSRKRATT
jgi:hypothetical protein